MNRVEVVGTLTRDAETTRTDRGFAIWEATLAVNGARFDPDSSEHVVTTVFVRVKAVGWEAEKLDGWRLSRGEELYVLGEFDQLEVVKEDGTKDTKTRVAVTYAVPTRRKPTPI